MIEQFYQHIYSMPLLNIVFFISITISWFSVLLFVVTSRDVRIKNNLSNLRSMLDITEDGDDELYVLKLLQKASKSSTNTSNKTFFQRYIAIQTIKFSNLTRDQWILCSIGWFFAITLLSFELSLLFAAIAASTLFFVTILLLIMRNSRLRKEKIRSEFPALLDSMVRAIQAGMTVSGALKFVAKEMPDPIGEEVQALMNDLSVGETTDNALNKFATRIDTLEGYYFSALLRVQTKSGGKLAQALEDLSLLIKSKKQAKNRIEVANSQSKGAFQVMSFIPIGVLGYQLYTNIEPWEVLLSSNLGRLSVAIILVWHVIGVFVMSKIVNVKV